MSDDVPVTEVFEDIEADPDAIITAYGATDVDDLLAGPEPCDLDAEPPADTDIEIASNHLSHLADVAPDPRPDAAASADPDGTTAGSNGGEPTESGASGPRYTAESVGGGATVDVLPGDGESFESFLGLDHRDELPIAERNDSVLVGPGPSASRVSNDSFASVDPSEGAHHDPSGRSPTWGGGTRPDPASVDSDTVTEREVELAESVFEWVS